MARRKAAPPAPATVRARAQANVGGLRRGQVVEVLADDPRLGHYLRAVDPPSDPPVPPTPKPPATLLGVAPAEEGDDAEQS